MTRGSFIARGALTAIATICMLPSAGSAAGNEQRCNELGAACLCSEPMNAGDNLPAQSDRFWNPSDTTTKECDGHAGSGQAMTMPEDYSTSANPRASAAGVPFNSGVDPYVYKGKLHYIHQFDADRINGLDEETTCIRTYRRYSNDTGTPGPTQRIKNLELARLSPPSHVDVQHSPGGNGSAFMSYVDAQYNAPDQTDSVPQFHQKCQAGWCRIEACADQIGTHLYYRYRITYLATGEDLILNYDAGEGPSSTFFDLPTVFLYVEGFIPGSQFLSYTMQTRGPVNRSFWIGKAYELEGGGGSNPPPPPPAAPVAPVLLQ